MTFSKTPPTEPVKHYDCVGCHHEHSGVVSQRCAACLDYDDTIRNDGEQVYHRFWTPKQPEPTPEGVDNFVANVREAYTPDAEPKAAPGLDETRYCAYCIDALTDQRAGNCRGCFGVLGKPNYRARLEPKSRPGLVPYPIIGGKGNELWLVQRPAGAIALYKAVGRTDFAYIETEIGDKFLSMQAFDDPPRRAWFRGGGKGTPGTI